MDDEPIVRRAASAALKRQGYEVLEAAGGPEAIDLFGRHHDSIDLVLLDLTMPLMTGEDVMRELQRMERNVRVLLSSGFNEVEASGASPNRDWPASSKSRILRRRWRGR